MRSRGFTLIELLVAMFITALVFAMGYAAVNQAAEQRDELEAKQQRLIELQRTMRILAQDFIQLAPRPVRQPVGDGWLPIVRAVPGDPERLVTLTRAGWANPAGIQRPALQRVAYVFEEGKLIREHWPVLDPTLAVPPVRRELIDSVRKVTFRYMDVARQWRPQWPSPGVPMNPLDGDRTRPIAVEVTLELEDWGTVSRIFEVAT